jgi:hypothetical protein
LVRRPQVAKIRPTKPRVFLGGWGWCLILPIGSMYGIYTNIGGTLMVNVTIYSIHGSYGLGEKIHRYISG